MKKLVLITAVLLSACGSNEVDEKTARTAPEAPPGALSSNPPMNAGTIDAIVDAKAPPAAN